MTKMPLSPVLSRRDRETELRALVHHAQAAVFRATDANREFAQFMLLSALREFTELVFQEEPCLAAPGEQLWTQATELGCSFDVALAEAVLVLDT